MLGFHQIEAPCRLLPTVRSLPAQPFALQNARLSDAQHVFKPMFWVTALRKRKCWASRLAHSFVFGSGQPCWLSVIKSNPSTGPQTCLHPVFQTLTTCFKVPYYLATFNFVLHSKVVRWGRGSALFTAPPPQIHPLEHHLHPGLHLRDRGLCSCTL